MKILIAHGDDFDRLLIANLAHWGLRVSATGLAQDALATLRRIRIDAVISDFRLKDRSGVWLLEQVRLLAPTTPRILVASEGLVDLERLVAHGVCDHAFRPPIDARILQTTLRNLGHARNAGPRRSGRSRSTGVPEVVRNDYTPTVVMTGVPELVIPEDRTPSAVF